MTRDELEAAVRWWVPRLGLSTWEIAVVWDEAEFSRHPRDAYTWRARDYDIARVYLHPSEATDWPARRAHATIVHELLHLVTRDVEHVLDLIDGHLQADVDAVIGNAHRHAVEGAVDRLAWRVVALAIDGGLLENAAP